MNGLSVLIFLADFKLHGFVTEWTRWVPWGLFLESGHGGLLVQNYQIAQETDAQNGVRRRDV